jgi:hypothetical protein
MTSGNIASHILRKPWFPVNEDGDDRAATPDQPRDVPLRSASSSALEAPRPDRGRCAFAQRAWLAATIVVGLLAVTAPFVLLRQRRTQRALDPDARKSLKSHGGKILSRACRSAGGSFVASMYTHQARRPRCVS